MSHTETTEAVGVEVDALLVRYFDTPTGQAAEYVDLADIRSLIQRIKDAYATTIRKETLEEGYNQGVKDMRMHIEEQISHEIMLGGVNTNKSRIEDYQLLIDHARSLYKH